MKRIELTDRIYTEDKQGRWTMDMPEFGIYGEPVYFDDIIDACIPAGRQDLAHQMDPMCEMRRQ